MICLLLNGNLQIYSPSTRNVWIIVKYHCRLDIYCIVTRLVAISHDCRRPVLSSPVLPRNVDISTILVLGSKLHC
jgi:hypothetical protein